MARKATSRVFDLFLTELAHWLLHVQLGRVTLPSPEPEPKPTPEPMPEPDWATETATTDAAQR